MRTFTIASFNAQTHSKLSAEISKIVIVSLSCQTCTSWGEICPSSYFILITATMLVAQQYCKVILAHDYARLAKLFNGANLK